jgi:hypothetical protein
MKKAIVYVLAMTLVFAFASLTVAAEKKEAAPAVKTAYHHITGDVVSVDAAANTIVVKEKKGDITVMVNDKTVIMSGKDKKTLADIKAGEVATVKYTEADGKKTAAHVEIKPAHAAKKPAAPAEKKK